MRNEASQPIIETLLTHIDSGAPWTAAPSAVPASRYVDRAQLAVERERLFRRTPQAVALSADLPEPGCFVTRDQLAVPLVVSRDEAGEVRGFANVCAHRGAQVVAEERGCRRRHSCLYHAWTYDTTGQLVGVPDRDSFPGVEVPGPGLAPVPVTERHGVIWAVPDVTAPAAEPELGEIGDDLDAFDIRAHRHWRSHRFDLAMNWKLVIDTFLEPYHFASLHRNTVGPIFVPNLCHVTRVGPHLREVLPRRTLTELADQPPETWDIVPHSAIVYVLFPATVFVMQIDHLELWRVAPDPLDPTRSVCDLDFYVPHEPATESSERHWEKNWKLTIDTVFDEDFAAMAGVQRGLGSGAIGELRVGANEPALGAFHDALEEALATPVAVSAAR